MQEKAFKVSIKEELKRAEMYYSILSCICDFKLTKREIELVAFTAIKGNISNYNIREEFCKDYNTSVPTINNIISKLKKFNIFIKDKNNNNIKIEPKILLDFKAQEDLVLHVKIITT